MKVKIVCNYIKYNYIFLIISSSYEEDTEI